MVRELKQYNYYDCVKEKLLRKIPPSREKADGSIKAAREWLEEAEKNLMNGTFKSSLMSSYLAMFHSARAILFFDGFREKSHYCIARYLEEIYVKKNLLEKRWIELLDHNRGLRHDDQYNLSFVATGDEAEAVFNTAKEFVERMSNLLENSIAKAYQ